MSLRVLRKLKILTRLYQSNVNLIKNIGFKKRKFYITLLLLYIMWDKIEDCITYWKYHPRQHSSICTFCACGGATKHGVPSKTWTLISNRFTPIFILFVIIVLRKIIFIDIY